MLVNNQLIGFGFNNQRSEIIELQRGTVWSDTVSRTTYTSTSFSIGTASAGRLVIAVIGTERTSAVTLSSVTIGGISATINRQISVGGGFQQLAAIASAVVPTGTTATVVATFSGATDGVIINTVSIDRLNSSTEFSGATDSDNSVDGICSTNVNIIDNCFVVSVVCNGASGTTFTWTNATEWNETGITAFAFGSAIERPTLEQVGYTTTVTSSAINRVAMCTSVFV